MEAEDHDESSESSTALSAGGQKFMAFEGLLTWAKAVVLQAAAQLQQP